MNRTTTKSFGTNSILTILASLFLLSFGSISFGAVDFEKRSIGILGELSVPVDWSSEVLASDKIRYSSHDGSSSIQVELLELNSMNEMQSHLLEKATQLSLPAFVRGFDRDLLDDANAENGGFILGTVVDSLMSKSIVDEEPPADKRVTDEENSTNNKKEEVIPPPNSASVYLMIVIYKKNNQFYQMQGYSHDLPAGSDLLYKIHRSWRLK
ncbi:hypothetical protein K8I28_16610 [bacterium]|nr:hypothetical protein [bacterium]